MRYPHSLPKNGTIGFVAPSFGCTIEPYHTAFLHAQDALREEGFSLCLGPNCYAQDGIGISSSPERCGEELNTFYADEELDCLISCGGGELMCEVLDYVDFEMLREAEPKWFMGFSDNTNLTFLLPTLCDVAAIYGPCAPAFGMEPPHPVVWDALGLLMGEQTEVSSYGSWESEKIKDEENPLAPYNLTEETILHKVPEGELHLEGRLLGGCLDCLVNLARTCYDKVPAFCERYQEDGILWFLESCDLNVFDIRRALWQLKHAGWFETARGFLIGRPLCFGEEAMGLTQYSAVLGVLGELGVPIIMDADLGHLPPSMPLINGAYAELHSVENELQLRFHTR